MGKRILFALTAIALMHSPAMALGPHGLTNIQHVVFILKENHTLDNYFGKFPGADGTSVGRIHTGQTINLTEAPDQFPADILHSDRSALLAMDGGRMDKFDLIRGAMQGGHLVNYTQYEQDQIPNYWAYASNFVLADEFFTSVHGPSFPNHLFTIAAQSGGAIDNPQGTSSWGCDSPSDVTVRTIASNGRRQKVPPCFDFPTVADSLNSAGLSWRYYGAPPGTPGYQWSPFDAISHIRFGPQWSTNVRSDEQFDGDVGAGDLASVTWITTEDSSSEHPARGGACDGENSTVEFVNAIMQSPQWSSTVIFISWDDFGGFYDHVAPPQLDRLGLGPRVPLLIVSPFSKTGYIEHQQLEFSSVVKFIEEIFVLPFLTQRDTNSNEMLDAFDFINPPKGPLILPIRDCPR